MTHGAKNKIYFLALWYDLYLATADGTEVGFYGWPNQSKLNNSAAPRGGGPGSRCPPPLVRPTRGAGQCPPYQHRRMRRGAGGGGAAAPPKFGQTVGEIRANSGGNSGKHWGKFGQTVGEIRAKQEEKIGQRKLQINPFGMWMMTSHRQCPRGGGGACECPRVGVFFKFWEGG